MATADDPMDIAANLLRVKVPDNMPGCRAFIDYMLAHATGPDPQQSTEVRQAYAIAHITRALVEVIDELGRRPSK